MYYIVSRNWYHLPILSIFGALWKGNAGDISFIAFPELRRNFARIASWTNNDSGVKCYEVSNFLAKVYIPQSGKEKPK